MLLKIGPGSREQTQHRRPAKAYKYWALSANSLVTDAVVESEKETITRTLKTYAGHAFQKNVAARNHRDDCSFHHFFLTDNVARYLSENIFALFAELLDVFLCNHFTFLFPLLLIFV